jgi:hypothetical protein
MNMFIHWFAGNWRDPWVLAVIGAEVAFFVGIFFLPGRWKNAVLQLAHDQRIPRLVRGMLVFGSLPIWGPVDEIVGTIGLVIVVCTPRMRAAFRDAIKTARQVAA